MKTILVVDDHVRLLEEVAEFLQLEGFHALTASNGREGVRMAMENQPDLILCDVMMPELDGYGLLQELRSYHETSNIPFIFLTAQSTQDNVRHGMTLGADDYLTKPFDYDVMLSAIESRLKRYEDSLQQMRNQADNYRRFIVTTLPHELRTPLMGILGAGELISVDAENLGYEQIKEMSGWIVKAGKGLHRLVENYLLYSQLYSGSAINSAAFMSAIQKAKTSYPTTLLIDLLKEKMDESARTADFNFHFGSDVEIQMSSEYLRKIAEEILDNALKFSNEGSLIEVETTIDADNFILRICDNGRGMASTQIKAVGAFVQFERDYYEQQGSGLGLAIAKRLIELHGGRLHIESQLNRGTQVLVEIPRSQ